MKMHYAYNNHRVKPLASRARTQIKSINGYTILFKNGWKLMSIHQTDCCEWHELDFEMLKDYNISTITGKPLDIYEQTFLLSSDGIKFEKVPNEGIVLYDADGNRFFVAGRGTNNGYYNSDIELKLYDEDGDLLWYEDVSECQNVEWC